MNSLGFLALAVSVGLLSGCGSLSPKKAAREQPPPAAAEEAARDPAVLEQRVRAHAHFATAVVQDLSGEPDQAVESLWQAAQADPANEKLVTDICHRLLQRQQAQKAVELLSRATAQGRASGRLYGWLGLAQFQLGKLDEAIAANRMAIKKAPKLLMGYQNLAQVYFQKKQPQEAIEVLDEAAAQGGASAFLLVELAEILAGASKTKALALEQAKPKVLAWLERVAQLKVQDPLLLQRMAEAYRAVGELKQATALYQELLQNHPPSNPAFTPLLREQLLQLYLRSGDRAGAAQQLKELLRDNPSNAQTHYLLGSLAADDKDYAEAADYFSKALLFNPNLEPVYYELAAVQLSLNQPALALETLGKARAKFAANFVLEMYTGLAHAALKQYAEALRSFTAAEIVAKASDPARLNHAFYFQLGSAYERSGDYAEAERQFRKCLAAAPDFAEALNYLGYMWAERGVNLEEARTLIEKAVKLEPKNAAYLDSLAWVLFKLKQAPEALKYMQQAIDNSEKPDATLYDHLGDICQALGRLPEAREAWRKSLELEPNEQIGRKLEGPAGPPTLP